MTLKLQETENLRHFVMLYDKIFVMRKKSGFTLMEVLVSVAIAGLVISAGFRLVGMSYKLMGELQSERDLISAAQNIWLRFRIDDSMSDNGTDDKNNIKWSAERKSVPVDKDYELKFKRVTVTVGERSTVIYVAE